MRIRSLEDNRADGDKPAAEKLKIKQKAGQAGKAEEELLLESAIKNDSEHLKDWKDASNGQGKDWNKERAKAFQKAVEQRTYDLYEQFYTDLNFGEWFSIDSTDTK